MRFTAALWIFIITWVLNFSVSAQEKAPDANLLEALLNPGDMFVYDDHRSRDPFSPLVTPSGAIITQDKDLVVTDMILEGIMTEGGGKNIAIINGRIVGKNDTIGTFVVIRIEKDIVILQKGQKIYSLKLKKEE
jgi:hypothetical protein